MTTSPVFLLSLGRSGTNMLRSMLTSAFPITDFGEIFRVKPEKNDHDFFPFLVERVRQDPEVAIPRQETQDRLFDEYLSYLFSGRETPLVLIDLKYPHTHNMNPLCHRPGKEPYILELIKRREHRIIHLVRRNVLARMASIKLALTTDNWVQRQAAEAPARITKVVLEVDGLVDELTDAVKRIHFFEDSVRDYPNLLTLFYEDLAEGTSSNPSLTRKLAVFLNQPEPPSLTPETVKIAPPLSDYIENFDEVRYKLKSTPFADMVLR